MPPKEVIIRDLVGNVVQGMTGVPYNEGDQVSLFCDATGGKLSTDHCSCSNCEARLVIYYGRTAAVHTDALAN